MKRLTVLMPVYNVAPYVADAIESVLSQTYSDFELLVLDDCSTDNTVDIVNSFKDSRIRLVRNEVNLGLAENLNKGIELANTEFIARMDGDDIACPLWLEKGVATLDRRPEVGICSFGFEFFGDKNSLVRFPEHNEDSKAEMLFGCTVIVPVFRRSIMVDNGLRYETSAFPAEDYSMWSYCYRVTQVYNVQETMFRYRTHNTQISTEKRRLQIEKANNVRLRMLDWLNPNFSESEKQFFVDHFATCNIRDRHSLMAIKQFADKLVSKNIYGHYSSEALARRCAIHITYSTLSFVEDHYFSKRYSLGNFIKLLFSGLYSTIPIKHRFKLLAKCILMRRK